MKEKQSVIILVLKNQLGLVEGLRNTSFKVSMFFTKVEGVCRILVYCLSILKAFFYSEI